MTEAMSTTSPTISPPKNMSHAEMRHTAEYGPSAPRQKRAVSDGGNVRGRSDV